MRGPSREERYPWFRESGDSRTHSGCWWWWQRQRQPRQWGQRWWFGLTQIRSLFWFNLVVGERLPLGGLAVLLLLYGVVEGHHGRVLPSKHQCCHPGHYLSPPPPPPTWWPSRQTRRPPSRWWASRAFDPPERLERRTCQRVVRKTDDDDDGMVEPHHVIIIQENWIYWWKPFQTK